MYLSSKQHELLQTSVTSFEIPYRTYIACTIVDHYKNEADFDTAIINKHVFPSSVPSSQVLNSVLGQYKKNSKYYYDLLTTTKNNKGIAIVSDEINVPNVSDIVCLSIIFTELFGDLIINYKDFNTFIEQSFKYKYVRNKLDHPGCKTLETLDLTIATDFMFNALLLLCDDESLFWQKDINTFLKQLSSLQSSSLEIPVEINNFQEMPFPDMRIVCRDKEIDEIKEFVYGRPKALKKPDSLVLYGYGGVGKTALALEALKQIVQDLQDNTTTNGYVPDFVLFFTAKDESLSFSSTTGKIENIPNKYSYKTSDELILEIYRCLGIDSFEGFNKKGIIVVDNLESLSNEERNMVHDFISYDSPQGVQYIITSRNEENFEVRKKIAGFNENESGVDFIDRYTGDNDLELDLSMEDKKTLLNISMGNTLVLVLCLRRLGLNIATINSMATELSSSVTVKKLKDEIKMLPANGFEIVSEFMFKNSFLEVQDMLKENKVLLSSILKLFAVYPNNSIDIYTIGMISKKSYNEIDPVLEILCKYLIVEKTGETYFLNQFARKYIIELFLPDAETYEKISSEIITSTRRIQSELEDLKRNIEKNESLRRIIQDWNIISDGDKIAAAKAFTIYGDVHRDCKRSSKFKIESALIDSIEQIELIESNTMHPYIKYQKARILTEIQNTQMLEDDYTLQILQAYKESIWVIKTNPLYSSIRMTKSYASILWKYGIELKKSNDLEQKIYAARYLEESKSIFEDIDKNSNEYFQCICLLGNTYLDIYQKNNKVEYLRKSRSIIVYLQNNRKLYQGAVRKRVASLSERLKKFGTY